MLNGILWLIGLVVVLAVYFFVPVGRHTLFEHTLRIAATEPAQELGEDLSETSEELGQRARDEWESRRETRQHAASGGDGEAPTEDPD